MGDDFARFEHEVMRRARLNGIFPTPVIISKRNAGVRTAGILARQSLETLEAIRIVLENGIKRFARGNEFVLPMAANVIVVSRN